MLQKSCSDGLTAAAGGVIQRLCNLFDYFIEEKDVYKKSDLQPDQLEILPDGRIVIVLHEGKLERPMSTMEVKRSFIDALNGDGGLSVREGDEFDGVLRVLEYVRKLVLK